jgi:hypothetical protein
MNTPFSDINFAELLLFTKVLQPKTQTWALGTALQRAKLRLPSDFDVVTRSLAYACTRKSEATSKIVICESEAAGCG